MSQLDAVVLENVTKRFGNHIAVDGVDLAIQHGAIHGFLGPNGSGKTTTLRLIMRLFKPDSGRVVVMGEDHGACSRDEVGYLPEERGLYKTMKVGEMLEFLARLKGVRQPAPLVDDWLTRFDLIAWKKKKIETLSKGMAQKVQFIGAILSRPKLALLDEPFSGLDPVNALVMRETLIRLREEGTTIILSTHDLALAEQMCDSFFLIHRGKKLLSGSWSEVQRDHGGERVRISFVDPGIRPDGVAGVAGAIPTGEAWELDLAENATPESVLPELLRLGGIRRFETGQASLSDIFLRLVGATAGASVGH
ncbi:MAG: ATP-binding cassette domain-containing protein [Planctomycetota bacterium]|nr:ATP-binding cassette domain-containing protein [Planctomycetota bacterium]